MKDFEIMVIFEKRALTIPSSAIWCFALFLLAENMAVSLISYGLGKETTPIVIVAAICMICGILSCEWREN